MTPSDWRQQAEWTPPCRDLFLLAAEQAERLDAALGLVAMLTKERDEAIALLDAIKQWADDRVTNATFPDRRAR